MSEYITKRLLSPIQVAEYLGISPAKTTAMIAQGLIPGQIRMSGVRRNFFGKKVFDRWLDRAAPPVEEFEGGRWKKETQT